MSFPVLHHPTFVFDMDSTLTRCESLPVLAREVGLEDEIKRMTEKCMRGGSSFQSDFPARVHLLHDLSVSKVQEIILHLPLHEKLADFIAGHPERCLIMTGNLDVWIEKLLLHLNMKNRCFSSHALIEKDHILQVSSVLDKRQAAELLPHPFIAVGDGDNDIGMLEEADLGIAFASVRQVSDHLIQAADTVISHEEDLCRLLSSYL